MIPWWRDPVNWPSAPVTPVREGDLVYAFDPAGKRWAVARAKVRIERPRPSLLILPPQPAISTVEWELVNMLTTDGRVIDVEQKCSASA